MTKNQIKLELQEAFRIQKEMDSKRKRVQLKCDEPTLTKESFQHECNINNIMSKYQKTGLIEHVSRYNGHYGDVSFVQDYATSLEQVFQANEAFSTLPSSIRAQFHNSPQEFMEFVSNPENVGEMVKLGLMEETVSGKDATIPETVPSGEDTPTTKA